MERKVKWTRGPVSTTFSDDSCGEGYIIGPCDNVIIFGGGCFGEQRGVKRPEDASLIASAFNAATACEDMGYDGEACVKALPELVSALNMVRDTCAVGGTFHEVNWLDVELALAKCRG